MDTRENGHLPKKRPSPCDWALTILVYPDSVALIPLARCAQSGLDGRECGFS